MPKQQVNIAELNRVYGFDWAINDFIVTDERYPIKDRDLPFLIDGYILGICLNGWLTIELNTNLYEGGESHMLVANPLQLFRFVELSEDCRVRFIIFSKRFLVASGINQQFVKKFQFSHPIALPVVQIDKLEAVKIVQQFEGIWDRFNEVKHPYRKEIVSGLLLVLLHDFEAIYRKHFRFLEIKSKRGKELTNQFTELVQTHFHKEHTVDFYARQLFVTSKYLTASIKEATGKTARNFISEALSMEAQALLQQPNFSVKEAAALLHFPDQSTFGRFFKRMVGVAPKDYIKTASAL